MTATAAPNAISQYRREFIVVDLGSGWLLDRSIVTRFRWVSKIRASCAFPTQTLKCGSPLISQTRVTSLSDAGNEPISLASLIVSGVTTASRSAKVLIDLHASHT